jgi:hypothetical protein
MRSIIQWHWALRPENIGPYVCSGRTSLNTAKAHIVRDALTPAIVER